MWDSIQHPHESEYRHAWIFRITTTHNKLINFVLYKNAPSGTRKLFNVNKVNSIKMLKMQM